MKVIIAGSRDIINPKLEIAIALYSCSFAKQITEVVSGTARGIDQAGEHYAELAGYKVKKFPANWNKYGKKAGYLRNVEMANYADALIAIWDGRSKGTEHMMNIAREKGLKLFVRIIND